MASTSAATKCSRGLGVLSCSPAHSFEQNGPLVKKKKKDDLEQFWNALYSQECLLYILVSQSESQWLSPGSLRERKCFFWGGGRMWGTCDCFIVSQQGFYKAFMASVITIPLRTTSPSCQTLPNTCTGPFARQITKQPNDNSDECKGSFFQFFTFSNHPPVSAYKANIYTWWKKHPHQKTAESYGWKKERKFFTNWQYPNPATRRGRRATWHAVHSEKHLCTH